MVTPPSWLPNQAVPQGTGNKGGYQFPVSQSSLKIIAAMGVMFGNAFPGYNNREYGREVVYDAFPWAIFLLWSLLLRLFLTFSSWIGNSLS